MKPPLAPPMDIGGEYKDDSFYLDTPVKPEYDKRRGTEYDGRERVGEGESGLEKVRLIFTPSAPLLKGERSIRKIP